MPRKKTIPLEHHLTQLLALRGVITMRSAMHYTGVVPPDPKGGGKACEHGAEKAADGRCVACKREADQRLYRNKAYRKAIASLVEQGIARPAGDGRWAYAGKPPMAGPKVRPRLPAEPGRVTPPDRTISGLMTAMQALINALPGDHHGGTTVFYEASHGRRQYGHDDCPACHAIEAQSADDHEYAEGLDGETPAQTIRIYSERQAGHERCNICDDIAGYPREDAALTGRLRRYESAMSAGRSYAYMPDGRRIQSDGSLCTCERCDERVRVRTTRGFYTMTTGTGTWMPMPITFDTVTMVPDTMVPDNRYEPDDGFEADYTRQCRDMGNAQGYICTARAGHAGNHMGWYRTRGGEPRRNDDATWPQVTSGDDTRTEER